MQEVFEKIIEKLEELKQKEKNRPDDCDENGYGDGEQIYEDGRSQGRYEQTVKIIEIIQQAAEEYNNGWIPCSERLPEEDGIYLATVDGEIVGEEKRFSGLAEFENGKWIDDEEDYQCILAWRSLPDPYQPRICYDKECPYNKGSDCPAAEGCAGYEPKQTNADRIRDMSNEELGEILLCPYDKAGKSINIMPCVKDGVMKNVSIEECRKCMLDWLQSEADEERRETVE